jgi:hypothetical protein
MAWVLYGPVPGPKRLVHHGLTHVGCFIVAWHVTTNPQVALAACVQNASTCRIYTSDSHVRNPVYVPFRHLRLLCRLASSEMAKRGIEHSRRPVLDVPRRRPLQRPVRQRATGVRRHGNGAPMTAALVGACNPFPFGRSGYAAASNGCYARMPSYVAGAIISRSPSLACTASVPHGNPPWRCLDASSVQRECDEMRMIHS